MLLFIFSNIQISNTNYSYFLIPINPHDRTLPQDAYKKVALDRAYIVRLFYHFWHPGVLLILKDKLIISTTAYWFARCYGPDEIFRECSLPKACQPHCEHPRPIKVNCDVNCSPNCECIPGYIRSLPFGHCEPASQCLLLPDKESYETNYYFMYVWTIYKYNCNLKLSLSFLQFWVSNSNIYII